MPHPTPAKRYYYLTDFIKRTYSVQLYKTDDIEHPALFFPADAAQRDDVDSVLGRLPTETETKDDFAIYDYAYLHTMQNSRANLFNGATFVMKQLRTSPLKIEARFGRYYDMIATCSALEHEARDAAVKRAIRVPLRRTYHREISAERAIRHGDGRSAALGCATLVIFPHEGRYHVLLSQRTAAHATRPNAYHVLPAFMFQPTTMPPPAHEWRLSFHVYREFLEELFGMAEVANPDVEAHPAMQDIRRMQREGLASLHLTGITMNLLTLRPEFSTLLLIRDDTWWQRVSAPDSPTPLQLNVESAAQMLIPIDTHEAFLNALPHDAHLNMPPHVIPSLWEGVALARSLISP